MNTHQANDQIGPEETIAEEAIAWLICMRDTARAAENPYLDPSVHSAAFFDWLKRSQVHLRIFMEFMELERRVGRLDASAVAGIQRLIETQENEASYPVQESPAPDVRVAVSSSVAAAQESAAPQVAAHARFPLNRKWGAAGAVAIAAGCAAIALVAHYYAAKPLIYSTDIGEHQLTTLADGSIVQLSTNSQVEINFSKKARAIRLIRGEAFFDVKHVSSQWPFVVTAADASLRALGTEFDVLETPRSVQVAVLSGTVEARVEPTKGTGSASALETSPLPVKASDAPHWVEYLVGGEMATISEGKVTRMADGNVGAALSWRHNRLVFDQVRLGDVAATFNRYNRVQIRVEGTAAQDTRVSGAFNTEGYLDLLWYVGTEEHLLVARDGENWVIRSPQ